MPKLRIAALASLTTPLALVVVALLGVVYNSASLHYYRVIAGVPGELFTVGGYKMHLLCTGHGAPAIILDAGLGDDSLIWAKVQPQLSQQTTVCAYDRAGFGW